MTIKAAILIFVVVHFFVSLRSQHVVLSGRVTNEKNEAVNGATVMLKQSDSARFINYRLTGAKGEFSMDLRSLQDGKYFLEVRHISFQTAQKTVLIPLPDAVEIQFSLKPRNVELKEVVIHREPPMVIRSDTIQFNAGSFKNAETRKLEDILKNINGFSVDVNGKIHFNGKPVEKVLIEGDDLADKGYRMITKNLNADIVDKIEVIDNYNDNRLLRNVSQSGNVGINIKVNPDAKNRVSGSVALGLSPEKRYKTDATMLYVSNGVKLMSYGGMNNIADDPYGNIRYYYTEENVSDEKDASLDGLSADILTTGSIAPPDVNEKYRNDNRDAAAAVMSSWKLGQSIKMKAIVGADWLSYLRRNLIRNNTYINDVENWSTFNSLAEDANMKDRMASISLHRDNQKSRVSQITLDVGTTKKNDRYRNLSTGSLVDSLEDHLNGNNSFARFKWTETFMLSGNRVLSTGVLLNGYFQQQLLNVESGRFVELYGLDSSYTKSEQSLENKHFSGELFSGIATRFKKWQFQAGLRLRVLSSDFKAATRFTENTYPHNVFDTGFQRMKTEQQQAHVFLNSGIQTGKAGFFSLRSNLGIASLQLENEHHSYPVINLEFSYSYKLTLLKTVHCKLIFKNDFDGFKSLYPRGLISGDGTVLEGLVYSGPTRSIGISAGYHSSNIYKQSQWGVNISYSNIHNQYNPVLSVNPKYSIISFYPFSPNALLFCSLNGEKFISRIKSKLGATIFFSQINTTYTINYDTGYSVRSTFTFEGRWLSGFPMPVNLETRARFLMATGKWEEQEPNVNHQFRLISKIKVTTSKKTYAAMAWNYYVLSADTKFHGLDAFIQYNPGKAWKISLQCNNLLNGSTIRDRKVMDISSSTSEYDLVGRYLLFRADIQL